MARTLANSRVNAEAVDSDEAFNRSVARKRDLDQDAKVTQIHDQPGKGARPARRTRSRTRNY